MTHLPPDLLIICGNLSHKDISAFSLTENYQTRMLRVVCEDSISDLHHPQPTQTAHLDNLRVGVEPPLPESWRRASTPKVLA